MKAMICKLGLTAFLALTGVATATTYYIDDNSNDGDVYTPGFTGNDSNSGTANTAPKLTLNNLLSSTNLLPGDIVLIDTGTYATNVVIGTNVNGAAGNPIVFQGASNYPAARTTFISSGPPVFEIQGSYLTFSFIETMGGLNSFLLKGARNCELNSLIGRNAGQSIRIEGGASSNSIRRGVFHAILYSAFGGDLPGRDNYMENCVVWSTKSAAFAPQMGLLSNAINNIGIGVYGMGGLGYGIDKGSHNILSYSGSFSLPYETLADYMRIYTNFQNNTVADPKFVDAEGFDFHLLSGAGFVSNGVWVTNAAVGYSPGIDFGARE